MSETSKHTPGPWTVSGEGRGAMVLGADLTIVAKRHRLPAPEHEANTRLIAAAPELLDSAQSGLIAAEALAAVAVDYPQVAALLPGLASVTGRIRAAIAKAEGR